jgi:hypothetical protein
VRRCLSLLALVATLAAVPEAEGQGSGLVVQVFTVKFRTMDEASSLIRPLLSPEGSVLILPSRRSLTVKDTPASVERVARALAAADLPPRSLSFSVSILQGGSGMMPGVVVRDAAEVEAAGERLKRMFNLGGYVVLDSVQVQGVEGDAVGFAIAKDYRLDFRLERSSDAAVARLKDLVLSRRREEGNKKVFRDVLRTSINVSRGQPFVLGVGRDETATGALFLLFIVRDVPAGTVARGER